MERAVCGAKDEREYAMGKGKTRMAEHNGRLRRLNTRCGVQVVLDTGKGEHSLAAEAHKRALALRVQTSTDVLRDVV